MEKANLASNHVIVDNVFMFSNNEGGGDDVAIQLGGFPEYACNNSNDEIGQYKN